MAPLTHIRRIPVEEYASLKGFHLKKEGIEEYMRAVSERIVDRVGGTEYGPASSFLQIVRAIALNLDEFSRYQYP